jgi:hypothetical protein
MDRQLHRNNLPKPTYTVRAIKPRVSIQPLDACFSPSPFFTFVIIGVIDFYIAKRAIILILWIRKLHPFEASPLLPGSWI